MCKTNHIGLPQAFTSSQTLSKVWGWMVTYVILVSPPVTWCHNVCLSVHPENDKHHLIQQVLHFEANL